MTEIIATGKNAVEVDAPIAEVFELLLDVPRVGMFWPGVDSIEPLGDNRYRWKNQPRTAAGKTFHTEYVALYENNGRDAIDFRSVEGNTTTRGAWRLRERGGRTEVSLEISSTVEIPIPRLMRKPAEIFAGREVTSGIGQQLERLKQTLERG